jgi:hypothetical protein
MSLEKIAELEKQLAASQKQLDELKAQYEADKLMEQIKLKEQASKQIQPSIPWIPYSSDTIWWSSDFPSKFGKWPSEALRNDVDTHVELYRALRQCSLVLEPDWVPDFKDENQDKYVMIWNHESEDIDWGSVSSRNVANVVYFSSRKTMEQAYEMLPEHLKKLVRGEK